MFSFWLTFFLALVLFIVRFPATIRRIRAQRHALRPVEPIHRVDHLPCIVNTIGVVFTEFALLGLLVVAVFLGLNAAIGTFGDAPDASTALRHISLGSIITISALGLTIIVLLAGAQFARHLLIMMMVLGIVLAMVKSTTGDQWTAISIFGIICYAVPAIVILILRKLF